MPFKPKMNLDYLNEIPVRINYRIVAGGGLHPIQMYDIIFDDYDYKIRGMERKLDEGRI